ncbi:unnamed protein product [Chondrus crispus]|uniref:Uncharacterized protein n=1 Tax=Chondrus crispus TaxID=2769 RepID=R7QBQ1_CHOCR|nr:unnamed protein product [Chondrus crispus]CDF34856.1 unnamed protein product [Chondrus crispus]|eukprot:XP_005714675.1 unnamed protein product [Chondrus crispus]
MVKSLLTPKVVTESVACPVEFCLIQKDRSLLLEPTSLPQDSIFRGSPLRSLHKAELEGGRGESFMRTVSNG